MGEPAPDSVEAVVFLVGDAGNALPGRSPVLADLRREVERWSDELPEDSAVVVLFLGDNVYPWGVRGPDHEGFPDDSLRLRSQADVVGGDAAGRRGTVAHFLPGNHDWGPRPRRDGRLRLGHQEELLDRFRAAGLPVRLTPGPGEPGPVARDVAGRVRIVLLDTQWWLAHGEADGAAARPLEELEAALAGAGARDVVLAAHHPFRSGGSHGGPTPLWEGLGILWLLRRTGAVVQDMNSPPYQELSAGLRAAFRAAGPPLVYAGGHDHSLQVIRGGDPDTPGWSLVSGSASKLSGVSRVPGMRLGLERPGYMRLTFVRGGGVLLHVRSTEGPPLCRGEGPGLRRCMEEAVEGFGVAWAGRLR